MQRTPCSYCSLPLATDEDDAALERVVQETGKVSTDVELFGQPLCWHRSTSDHPNGGELIAALKFWRERAASTAAAHEALVDQFATLSVAVNHAILCLDTYTDAPTFVASALRNTLEALQQDRLKGRGADAAIATALEHLQKAEAALKTALDNFRATALAAGKVMP